MKKLIAILIVFLLCYSTEARNLVVVTAGVPVAGGSCSATPSVSNTSTADYDTMGGSITEAYRGQGSFVPAANGTICRVDFYIKNTTADTDWVAAVYEMSGTALGTLVDASSTQALAGADQWTSFSTGLSAAVVTTKSYGIVLQHYPISYASGGAMYHSATSDGGVSGTHVAWYGDDKTQSTAFAGDISIKIYYME